MVPSPGSVCCTPIRRCICCLWQCYNVHSTTIVSQQPLPQHFSSQWQSSHWKFSTPTWRKCHSINDITIALELFLLNTSTALSEIPDGMLELLKSSGSVMMDFLLSPAWANYPYFYWITPCHAHAIHDVTMLGLCDTVKHSAFRIPLSQRWNH